MQRERERERGMRIGEMRCLQWVVVYSQVYLKSVFMTLGIHTPERIRHRLGLIEEIHARQISPASIASDLWEW